MSANPYFLELLAKARQEELLAMARPRVVPIPLSRRGSLWDVRQRLARWLIRIGLRLKNRGASPVCPFDHGGHPAPPFEVKGGCICPRRGDFAVCPPVNSG